MLKLYKLQGIAAGGFVVKSIKFKCIHIELQAVSRHAQMELLRKCKESPDFLQKWITKLLKPKQLKQLKTLKERTIEFTINIEWPVYDAIGATTENKSKEAFYLFKMIF